jgi:hypothetical protein
LIILLIKNLIIQSGTTGFTNDVLANATSLRYLILHHLKSIRKKSSTDRKRLYTSHKFYLYKTTKKDLQDKTFYQFKTKIESAGSLLSTANTTNQSFNANGNREIFNLEYSEYIKTEFDYIKHWDLSKEKY